MRKAAGLTQRQLAAKVGRERNLIGRLELGERRLDVVEFYSICRACRARPDLVSKELMREFEQIESAGI
ncbi:MAG: transcriptional regulator [Verrucomicrobia bacterium]|nr:MAG: transcriptional regulator [Verrucomicrobiota bacterium]